MRNKSQTARCISYVSVNRGTAVILDTSPGLRRLIRRFFWRLGLDIRRYTPGLFQSTQLITLLEKKGVDVAIDVGANVGQFAQELLEGGYLGSVVSFEPLSSAHKTLCDAAHLHPNWTIAPRMALGDYDGEIEIQVAGNLVSSSILKMAHAHENASPRSRYVNIERTPIRRLDGIVEPFLNKDSKVLLKIDTQGYEDKVLRGAIAVLSRVHVLQLELSLVELYEGQLLFHDMLPQLLSKGFHTWALWPTFSDPQSGQHLQVDALFVRTE